MNTLLTGAFSYTEEQILKLQQMGLEVDFLQYETDNITHYEKYDAVVCNGLFLHHDIKKFTKMAEKSALPQSMNGMSCWWQKPERRPRKEPSLYRLGL